jgi:hypothetical protein
MVHGGNGRVAENFNLVHVHEAGLAFAVTVVEDDAGEAAAKGGDGDVGSPTVKRHAHNNEKNDGDQGCDAARVKVA